jgi:hypothetical protein
MAVVPSGQWERKASSGEVNPVRVEGQAFPKAMCVQWLEEFSDKPGVLNSRCGSFGIYP